jgi:ABC-type branched-subunit amino acid transport system ATPase component
MMALMGATGSGKTTLLSTLAHRNELGLRTWPSLAPVAACRVVSCGVQVQPVQVGAVVAMPLTLRCRLWGFRHIRVDPLRI